MATNFGKKGEKKVNIPRDVKDEFYRYTMPVLQAKVEGRGNGIKTVIVNMTDIAKDIGVPPSYPTKFFGFEVGSVVTLDDENDRYVVNGKHSAEALAKRLDLFIEKFVLCETDRNPETIMNINSKGDIELVCKACGHTTPVDMTHKLSTFIQKNPPTKKKDVASSVVVSSKQARREAKKKQTDGSGEDSGEDNNNTNDSNINNNSSGSSTSNNTTTSSNNTTSIGMNSNNNGKENGSANHSENGVTKHDNNNNNKNEEEVIASQIKEKKR